MGAKDQIALKRQSMSSLELLFNDALCLFFWEIHFLISWTLWRLAREYGHIKPLDFLFYLWTTKSIVMSPAPAHSLLPAPLLYTLQKDGPTLSILLSNQDYLDQAISWGEWGTGWSSTPQCLRESVKEIPRTLTHLIEISWPISSEIRNLAFLPWAVFPQRSKWKKLFSSFICFLLL